MFALAAPSWGAHTETLETVAADLAAADTGAASDDDLFAAATSLERARRLLDAAEGHVLAELDARDACDHEHGLRTPRWLAREAALPASVAAQRVRVACKLRDHLGSVDGLLSSGAIGWEHARVLADAANPRIAAEFDDEAAELARYAEGTLFERWRRDVAARAEELDVDGGHDPAADRARNKLSVARTFGDLVHLKGTLVGETGLVVEQAVEAKADELFRRFRRDSEQSPELTVPTRATLRALAMGELCRLAISTDPTDRSAPRPDVTLVVSAADPDTARTPEGTALPDGSVEHLLCDPALTPMVISALGVPLAMGRQTRFATAAQRRAMAVRDQGCVFPGCDAPVSWTDAHHLDHWHDHHGSTDVDRMASLCRHHHGVTHRTGWEMHTTPDGWFWWVAPSGRTFWSQRGGRQRAGPAPPPDGSDGAADAFPIRVA